MLTLSNVRLRRGPQILIDEATLAIYRGEKVGIIGRNGCGKSTLLSLIRGELTPDMGDYCAPPNLAMASVAQELPESDAPLVEYILDGDLELRHVLLLALQEFPGAVVVVSHDRALLRGACDTFLLVANGAVSPFDGDLEDYASWLAKSGSGHCAGQGVVAPVPSRREQRRVEAEARNRLTPLRTEQRQMTFRHGELLREIEMLEERWLEVMSALEERSA